MKKQKKKSMAMSKKILIISYIVLGVCLAFTFFAISQNYADLTQLEYINVAAFAQCTAATSFYYNKSKAENTTGGIIYDMAMKNTDNSSDEQAG